MWPSASHYLPPIQCLSFLILVTQQSSTFLRHFARNEQCQLFLDYLFHPALNRNVLIESESQKGQYGPLNPNTYLVQQSRLFVFLSCGYPSFHFLYVMVFLFQISLKIFGCSHSSFVCLFVCCAASCFFFHGKCLFAILLLIILFFSVSLSLSPNRVPIYCVLYLN